MKNPIINLNKSFESLIRLGIMSILIVNDRVDFNTLKEDLETTDGNLASHIKALEADEMINVTKQFIGRKPNTSYKLTSKGRKAFIDHLDALEKLLRKNLKP